MDKPHRADRGARAAGRRPRLDDVAARAGVSPGLASLVLRDKPGPAEDTRKRVLKAAEQLDYRPDRAASLLARRRSHLIGVMLDIRNTFHTELVEHLQAAAKRVDYDLVLSTVTPSQNEQQAIETLLDSRCEALILLGPETPGQALNALSQQLPVVAVGRRIASTTADVVRTADDQGVGKAIDFLVDLGHRAITFVDGGKGTIASDRRRGYRKAMRRHDLDKHINIIPGNPTEEAGIRAAETLLNASILPTAVLAHNDRCAVGLLASLVRAGVNIPSTVSVVGYDDSILARLAHVDLTTVSQNSQQQAEHSVVAAVQRLDEGRHKPSEVLLTPHVVVRGTTGPTSRPSERNNVH